MSKQLGNSPQPLAEEGQRFEPLAAHASDRRWAREEVLSGKQVNSNSELSSRCRDSEACEQNKPKLR